MEKNEKIEELLDDVSDIIRQSEAEAQKSGSGFNFISVINEEKKEDLHSRIITELINPQGSHGAGVLFLKPFFEIVLGVEFYDNTKYLVKREHYIGALNNKEDKPAESSGGKIDIYIEGGGKKIAIENKIDAVDQKHQIRRYYNYTKSVVYYLTLDGKMSSQDSHSHYGLKDGEGFKRISYQNNILKWLAECEKLAAEKSELVVIIRQYIRIVKKITDKMSEMEREINERLNNNKEYLKAAYAISDTIQKRKKKLFQDIVIRLRKTYTVNDTEKGDNGNKLMKIHLGEYNGVAIHWVAGVAKDFYYMITITGADLETKIECVKKLELDNNRSENHILTFKSIDLFETTTDDIVKEALVEINNVSVKLNGKESN